MKKQCELSMPDNSLLRNKIIGLSETSGRKSYYPLLQQKIQQLQEEVVERKRVENTLRKTLARIDRQQTAMADIATLPTIFEGKLAQIAPFITTKMNQALKVDQASLWVMEKQKLCCLDKFFAQEQKHISGQCLDINLCTNYLASLGNGLPVAVTDVFQDPRTIELADHYFSPNCITALLDAPVLIKGELIALISLEHTTTRHWWSDELTFASRMADQIALILANEQRLLAEKQLHEAHTAVQHNLRFTKELLNAIPIPVFYEDTNACYLGCNRSFTEIMGYTTQEIQGKTAREIWPQLPSNYEDNDDLLFSHKGKSLFESVIPNKDKQLRDVLVAKQIFYTSNNHVGGMITSFQDITALKKSAKETQQLRSILSNIINSMPSMLIGVDTDLRITQWNTHCTKITGIGAQDAQGKLLTNIAPWIQEEIPKIRQVIAYKRPFFGGRVTRTIKEKITQEDITVYPLVTDEGIQGAVIRIDDVTDKVRIEEMLAQSEKILSIGGLAAGMAHEINTPLTSILGNTQVIETRLWANLPKNQAAAQHAGITLEGLRTYLEQREIGNILNFIRNSGAQAAQIITDMLNFSRKNDPMLLEEDVRILLDKTVDLASKDYNLKKEYDFKKINIQRDYAEKIPKIYASGNKLQQVFLNLLRNGAEAMLDKNYAPDKEPTFILRIYPNSPWVRVEIEDNGCGVEEIVRKRIFEPFFTTKPVGKGTGLGLSVSYFIICEEHSGLMAVESVPGQWTRFTIDLPATPLMAS
jgi:PAS domain S-box-containing protein